MHVGINNSMYVSMCVSMYVRMYIAMQLLFETTPVYKYKHAWAQTDCFLLANHGNYLQKSHMYISSIFN